jgi:hypothetical protein
MALLLAGLLALQPAAAAQDWWYFSVAGDIGEQQAFYIDRSSISRSGDLVSVQEARQGERADAEDIIGARLHVRYDCRARTSQVLRYTFILTDGSGHIAARAQDRPQPVGPDSVSAGALAIACGEAEGLEQLGTLSISEQARLLFAERAAHLRANPDAPR